MLYMKHYNYKIKSLHHFVYNIDNITCYHQHQYVIHRVNSLLLFYDDKQFNL